MIADIMSVKILKVMINAPKNSVEPMIICNLGLKCWRRIHVRYPGIENSVSTMKLPVSMKQGRTGIRNDRQLAFFSACLMTTFLYGVPLERASMI